MYNKILTYMGVAVGYGAVVLSLYYVCDKVLKKKNKLYRDYDNTRQLYIQKNVVKAFLLSGLSTYATYSLVQTLGFNCWTNSTFYVVGILYAVPDLVGLFVVPNLQLSTKIHHTCVTVLSILNTCNDYTEPTFWRGVVVYAIYSVLSYPVNLYLGTRFLYPNSDWIRRLCKFSLYSYFGLCMLNWYYQYQLIFTNIGTMYGNPGFYIYMALIHMIIWDDIKLMSFLNYSISQYNLVKVYRNTLISRIDQSSPVPISKAEMTWLLRMDGYGTEANEIKKMTDEKYHRFIKMIKVNDVDISGC